MQILQKRAWDWQIALIFIGMLAVSSGRLVMTRWTDHLVLAQAAAILGAILGLALAASKLTDRSKRLMIWDYSLVFLPWILLGTIQGQEALLTRLASLTGRLGYSLGQFIRAEEVTDPLLFVAFCCLVFWFVGIYSGQAILRENANLAGLLPPSLPILLIQYYDNYPPGKVWLLGMYFGLVLLAIGRRNYLQNDRLWREKGIFTGTDPEFDLNRSVIIVTLLLVILAWSLPTPANALPAAARWWNSASKPLREAQERLGKALSSLNSQQPPPRERYGDQLTLGNRADQGEGILFRVDTPPLGLPRYYWRARVYDTYTSTKWSNSPMVTRAFEPDSENLPVVHTEGQLAEFEFEWLFEAQGTLLAHPQPVWVSRSASVQYASLGNGQIDINGLKAAAILAPGERYTARSIIHNPTILELRQAGEDYPEWVLDRYLKLPENLPARITALAVGITDEAETPYDKAERITTYLRENITYDENVPFLPPGADPLESFLFDWKRGYCTYSASAQVIMLRAVGVPARLAVGYAQGELSRGRYVVRSKDAHAWPEVYFPGIGWVEFEPTGNQPPLVRPRGEIRPLETAEPPTVQRPIPQFNDDPLPTPSTETAQPTASQFPYMSILRWIIIIAAIGLFIFGLWKLHRRTPFATRALQATLAFYRWRGRSLPNWLEHWQRWNELSDVERAFHVINQGMDWFRQTEAASMTPAERVARLIKLLPQATNDIETLAHEHEMTLYSPTPGNATRARRAAWRIRFQLFRSVFDRFFPGAHA